MRINRTFSIPVALATELKRKPNQSETVTRALRKYLDNADGETLEDATISIIITELQMRFEPFSPQMELLKTLRALTS
uniref:Ribbon-helix-helix protein CopG domain-containing protein n=1 Tax=uncultured prokaryote TaxID=198431 RepID=A0A0H5Q7Z1_9ZZZZ|nr:hypothetical protein [uncultured prokaryote]